MPYLAKKYPILLLFNILTLYRKRLITILFLPYLAKKYLTTLPVLVFIILMLYSTLEKCHYLTMISLRFSRYASYVETKSIFLLLVLAFSHVIFLTAKKHLTSLHFSLFSCYIVG